MGSEDQGLLGSSPSGQRSAATMPGSLEDEFYDSHTILRGKEILLAEGQSTLDEFEVLLKDKSKVKPRLTSMKTATENDLKNAGISTASRSYLHNTMITSMLDMKHETLGKEKAKLNRIFTKIIAIIEAYDSSPAQGREWKEVENFKEWREEGQKFSQFGEHLIQMSNKVIWGQDMGTDL